MRLHSHLFLLSKKDWLWRRQTVETRHVLKCWPPVDWMSYTRAPSPDWLIGGFGFFVEIHGQICTTKRFYEGSFIRVRNGYNLNFKRSSELIFEYIVPTVCLDWYFAILTILNPQKIQCCHFNWVDWSLLVIGPRKCNAVSESKELSFMWWKLKSKETVSKILQCKAGISELKRFPPHIRANLPSESNHMPAFWYDIIVQPVCSWGCVKNGIFLDSLRNGNELGWGKET